jgi:hypothetical protein
MAYEDSKSKYHRTAVIMLGDVAVGSISLYSDQFSDAALANLTGAGITRLLDDSKFAAFKGTTDKVLVTDTYNT